MLNEELRPFRAQRAAAAFFGEDGCRQIRSLLDRQPAVTIRCGAFCVKIDRKAIGSPQPPVVMEVLARKIDLGEVSSLQPLFVAVYLVSNSVAQ